MKKKGKNKGFRHMGKEKYCGSVLLEVKGEIVMDVEDEKLTIRIVPS